jgi:para-nitrobenzyl esterase
MQNFQTGRRVVAVLAAAVGMAVSLLSGCASGIPRQNQPPATIQPVGEWTGEPQVRIRYGAAQGYPDADHTWVWRAIPYAAPPVGDLRWRAPQDPAPWNGVRQGLLFNAGCTQYPLPRGRIIAGTEDCLYLNVWRPQTEEVRLPVYVWIHGGGNSSGSSTEIPAYYGNRVASLSTMVFVSLNYRLGPFGWFASPAFRDEGSPEEASGDFGTLDIIKALTWIRDNITAFGGDPSRVTITGQSAGAADVLSLLLSPLASGLFQRAIYESGLPTSSTRARGGERASRALRTLLVRDHKARGDADARLMVAAMSPKEIRAYLRSKSDREILGCYETNPTGILDNPSPLLDGRVLPIDGYKRFDTGDYPNKVPLILGSNKEEAKLFLMLSTIPWQSDLYAAVARFGSELWKAAGVDALARKLTQVRGQPRVYAYRFDWGAPDAEGKSVEPAEWGKRLGAFHDLEIPFILGQETLGDIINPLIFSRASAPGRYALSSAMMSYAAQFARTGNPNRAGSGLPEWRPWSNRPAEPKYIVFDADNDAASLVMSDAEMTQAGVEASLQRELVEPVRSEVLEILSTTRME